MSNFITEGIVLQKINYSESSLILKVYTENEGLKSFIFQGAKSKKKNSNIIFPFSILEISYFQRKDSDLAKISSVETSVIYKEIPFDPIKSSIVFFLNEIIIKCIKEEEKNHELYIFLKNSFQILDVVDEVSNFPVQFLWELTKFLGFYPQMEENPRFFDILKGKFCMNTPLHPNYLDEHKTKNLLSILPIKLGDKSTLKLSGKIRREILNDLLSYYRINIDGVKDLKSLSVIETVFY